MPTAQRVDDAFDAFVEKVAPDLVFAASSPDAEVRARREATQAFLAANI